LAERLHLKAIEFACSLNKYMLATKAKGSTGLEY
jgi:hypothetical protein